MLINQLKEVGPAIQNSIAQLTEEVNSVSSTLLPMAEHHARSHSLVQARNSRRTLVCFVKPFMGILIYLPSETHNRI